MNWLIGYIDDLYHEIQKPIGHKTVVSIIKADTVIKHVVTNFHDLFNAKNRRKNEKTGFRHIARARENPAASDFLGEWNSKNVVSKSRKRTIIFTCPSPKENLVGNERKESPRKSKNAGQGTLLIAILSERKTEPTIEQKEIYVKIAKAS